MLFLSGTAPAFSVWLLAEKQAIKVDAALQTDYGAAQVGDGGK